MLKKHMSILCNGVPMYLNLSVTFGYVDQDNKFENMDHNVDPVW